MSSDKLYRLKHASSGLYLTTNKDQEKLRNMSFSRALMSKIQKQTAFNVFLSQKLDSNNL